MTIRQALSYGFVYYATQDGIIKLLLLFLFVVVVLTFESFTKILSVSIQMNIFEQYFLVVLLLFNLSKCTFYKMCRVVP